MIVEGLSMLADVLIIIGFFLIIGLYFIILRTDNARKKDTIKIKRIKRRIKSFFKKIFQKRYEIMACLIIVSIPAILIITAIILISYMFDEEIAKHDVIIMGYSFSLTVFVLSILVEVLISLYVIFIGLFVRNVDDLYM